MPVLPDTLCYFCLRTFFIFFWVTALRIILFIFISILIICNFQLVFFIKLLLLLLIWFKFRRASFLPFQTLILACRLPTWLLLLSLAGLYTCFPCMLLGLFSLLLFSLSFFALHSQEEVKNSEKDEEWFLRVFCRSSSSTHYFHLNQLFNFYAYHLFNLYPPFIKL